MNEFQKEGQEIFKNAKLSDERKRNVIDAVHTKQKRKSSWLPAVVVTCALGIGSFLLFAPSEKYPTEEELYTASSLEPLIEQQLGDTPYETLQMIQPFIKDNGTLIINKVLSETDNEWYYNFLYAERINDKWKVEVPFYSYENSRDMIEMAGEKVFYGFLNNSNIDHIFVGEKEATILKPKDDELIWFGQAKSNYSPVYFEIDGERIRQKQWSKINEGVIPIIEGISNEKSLTYTRNTMHRGNNEYSEFPLLYDPYYYAENPYQSGDVVVIETENGSEVTRIIDANQNQVIIDESTLIIEQKYSSYGNDYFLANYDGDTSIYDKERTEFKVAGRDEVFVHPDNWGSDGVKGPIAKTEIKGKVLGYDLHGVTNTMKQDELNMYSMVQEMIQKIKTTDYKDNTVTTFLTGVTPQTIAKLYYYAAYKENYEMMYALYARKEGAPPAYGRWLQNQRAQTQSMLQHNLVKIYYVDHSTLSKERSQLELYDDAASNLVFKLRMKEEDGVWKVLYATVSKNR